MEEAVSTPLISSAVCLSDAQGCHAGNSGKWGLRCGKRKYYMGTFMIYFILLIIKITLYSVAFHEKQKT